MNDVQSIDKNKPHFNALALCLNCQNTWIATFMAGTNLFRLQCPKCNAQKSFASILPDEYTTAVDEMS